MINKKDRKKIFRKYKYYKKLINSDKYFQDDNVILNEKGQAILQLNVEKYNNVVSDYCMPDYEIFDEGFADFIVDNVEYIDMQHDLVIEMFFNDELNEKQQNIVKKTLKRHFAERVSTNKEDLYDYNKKSYAFGFIGAAVFILCSIFKFIMPNIFLVLDVIDFASWFFMWTAIDNYFDNSLKVKEDLITSARIWNAEIVIKKLNPAMLIQENDEYNTNKKENT